LGGVQTRAERPTDVAVVGAGSWGTALARLLAAKGHRVSLWGRSPALVRSISERRENAKYLPGVVLPESLRLEEELEAAVAGKGLVVVAVPSCGMREIAARLGSCLTAGAAVVSTAKGLDAETGLRMSETLIRALPAEFHSRVAVLSGPNLAREVAGGVPTTSVAAAEDPQLAHWVQACFSTPLFRTYTNDDVAGVELGGALKNIIAIGAGINDGLGFGDNTKAALMTRGLVEMVRLGTALGAKAATFFGLSGLGDLVATCASRHSRNWTVGHRLARGERLEEILGSMDMVAEGVPTTEAAMRLASERRTEMPITQEVYRVLFEGKSPEDGVRDLMSRAFRDEADPQPHLCGQSA
jgi:glycerol-3-phosphate dehydrogenase (NAD(P)+)